MKCRRCRKDRSAQFCEDCGARLDVTELGEAEQRVSWVLEHISDVVSVVGQDGIIQYESPSVERLLGWRPDELLGRHILDYVHPDDVARVSAAIARRIADPAPVNPPTEFRVRARDGSWRVLAAMSRVTQDEGGAVSLVVTSRDVTEQRVLEDRGGSPRTSRHAGQERPAEPPHWKDGRGRETHPGHRGPHDPNHSGGNGPAGVARAPGDARHLEVERGG